MQVGMVDGDFDLFPHTSDHCHSHHRHRHLHLHRSHPLHPPHLHHSGAMPLSFAWQGSWGLSRDSVNRRGSLVVLRLTSQIPRHRHHHHHLSCSFSFLSGGTMTTSHSEVSQSPVSPGFPSEHPSFPTRTLQPPGWLLDQAATFTSFKKAGAPVVLGPPKRRGWARYVH